MGPGPAQVALEDAVACIDDNSARSFDDLAFAVADGDLQGLDRTFPICLALPKSSPVRILRIAAGHFLRIHSVRARMRHGTPRDAAMKALRPPIFYKLVGRFQGQLDRWTEPAIAAALDRLTDAERACKRTGAPAEALAHRALMQITQQAARAARGRAGR
jgi:DNA polymerase-3 subunit delta